MRNVKYILVLLIVGSIASCDNDNEMSDSDQLIGEWLRNDYSDDLEFKLIFNSNNTGIRTFKQGNEDTGIVSSAIQFNWSIHENSLTLNELEDVIITSFSFNSEGQLILKDYSNLPFVKVE